MSIKRTIITTIVALAMVATVAPGSASAVTIEELLAQITLLQSQLTALQGTGTGTGTSTYTACVGVTFTRALTVGSTGSDVKCLQQVLNGTGYTVSETGAGSPGAETTYFGAKTLAAVKLWQAAQGWTPANQVGPLSRAKLNSIIAGSGPVNPNQPVGPVSAVLSFDNPASGSVIASQAQADLLHINFTGNGTVTSVTLQRTGISTQNTLSNVYLYDGATRLTDGYTFNVNGTLTINGLNIPVNGSHVISVKADVASSAYIAGTTEYASSVAVAMTGFNGGSANVQGNTFAIVTGTTATAYVSATATPSTDQTPAAGTSQFTVWSDTLNVVTRAVQLKGANFKIIGSAPSNALGNIRLFVDGVDAGTVATVGSIQGNNYAMFNLATPVSLTTGAHVVDVRADIVTGAARTFTVSLQQPADLVIFDPQIGVNIALTGSSDGATAFSAKAATQQTIQTGSSSIDVDPTFNSLTNVTAGASNVTIGKFIVHGYGEDVKVSDLYVKPVMGLTISGETGTGDPTIATSTCSVTGGTCTLSNVTVYLNGMQIGTQKNWTATTYSAGYIDYSMGSQMIIPAGQDSTLEIKADLQTTGGVNYTGGAITAVIVGQSSSNAIGQTSQSSIKFPDTTDAYKSGGLTISAGTLAVSANPAYSDQTVSPNADVKLASYTLQNQSTSEAVRLTTLALRLYDSDGTTAMDSTTTSILLTDVSNLKLSGVSNTTPIQPTATNTFSVNDVLQPGQSITVDVLVHLGNDSSGTIITKLDVSGLGASSNTAVYANSAATAVAGRVTGQTIALGSGSLSTPTLVTSTTTPAQYIPSASGQQGTTRATFNFVASNSPAYISELRFTTSTGVTKVCVGSVCGTPASGTAIVTPLNLTVPTTGGLPQNVDVTYSPIGTNGVFPGTTSYVSLSYVKYTAGGATTTMCASGCTTTITAIRAPSAAGSYTLVGSLPTVTVPTATNTLTIGAQNKIGSVTVAASSQGAVKIRQLYFSIAASGWDTGAYANITDTAGTTPFLSLAGSSTQITGAYCDITDTTNDEATILVTCTFNSGSAATYASDFLIPAGASQTFDLYAIVGGTKAGATTASRLSATLTAASFQWDDTSANGAGGTGLTGTLVPNFPTNSYVISDL